MEKLKKSILLCNIVCILLMLCLVAGQFIPFWEVTGEVADSGSLFGVIGRQYVHMDLIEKLDEITGGFTYQNINTQVLLTTFLGVFAIILCAQNSNGWLRILMTLVSAGSSASLWLMIPAYKLGVLGHILFGISVALLVVALLMIYLFVQEKLIEKREREI